MDYSFTQHFTVRSIECDTQERMTPSYILKYAQEAATAHCDALGLEDEIYKQTNTAFLMAKLGLECTQPIMCGTEITLVTKAYAPERAMFMRSIELLDSEGRRCALVSTVWILVDTLTKRIVRRAPQEISHFFTEALPEHREAFNISITKCPTMPCAIQKALYTMCDRNMHINNTVYADIICNSLPQELLCEHYTKQLLLSYHSEIPMNVEFGLHYGEIGDNSFYFVGDSQDKKYFEANITFA